MAGYDVDSLQVVDQEAYMDRIDSKLMDAYCRVRNVIPPWLRERLISQYIKSKRIAYRALTTVPVARRVVGETHLLAVATPRGA